MNTKPKMYLVTVKDSIDTSVWYALKTLGKLKYHVSYTYYSLMNDDYIKFKLI